MAEENGNNGGQPAGGAAQGAAAQPAPQNLGVLAQYVKDLSFENPNAPGSLGPVDEQPQINLKVDVGVKRMNDNDFEVSLKIGADATVKTKSGKAALHQAVIDKHVDLVCMLLSAHIVFLSRRVRPVVFMP